MHALRRLSLQLTWVLSTVSFLAISFSAAALSPNDDFVTTWDTTNPGTSNNTSITVPMVGGPYDVDWNNNGTFDETNLSGSVTHDFGAPGQYTIRIRGSYDSIRFNNDGDREKILSIDQWGSNAWTTMDSAFYGAENLQISATDTPNFTNVTSMSFMFSGASSANPDTSGWDTGNVTNMQFMFQDAVVANPNTANWNTSNVTQMAALFLRAGSANPDTSNWDTSNVVSMGNMFTDATSANPDTSNWNTSNVTSMSFMFAFATSANPDTSNWNTGSIVNMQGLFAGATAANPDVSNWDTSQVQFMSSLFSGAESATPDTSTWNTESVTTMAGMFASATSANPDVSNWNTANVTNLNSMFGRASAANPDVSNWNTANVTSSAFMFQEATNFDRDLANWDVSSLTDARSMFFGTALSTANYDSLLVNWSAQTLQSGVEFDGGDSTYCSSAAAAAREAMINDDNWTITDRGACSFTVGGNVNGLTGSGLVLQNNGGDDLPISANGAFTFATALADTSAYNVTVATQPSNPIQTCTVNNANGSINAANVTDVDVSCTTEEAEVTLSVSEIDFGNLAIQDSASMEVTNNGTGELIITAITDPASPFFISGGTCTATPVTLLPGESCSIEVGVASTGQSGTVTASFDIESNAPSSPNTVSLTASFSVVPIPTLERPGLIILILLLGLIGWRAMQRS